MMHSVCWAHLDRNCYTSIFLFDWLICCTPFYERMSSSCDKSQYLAAILLKWLVSLLPLSAHTEKALYFNTCHVFLSVCVQTGFKKFDLEKKKKKVPISKHSHHQSIDLILKQSHTLRFVGHWFQPGQLANGLKQTPYCDQHNVVSREQQVSWPLSDTIKKKKRKLTKACLFWEACFSATGSGTFVIFMTHERQVNKLQLNIFWSALKASIFLRQLQ